MSDYKSKSVFTQLGARNYATTERQSDILTNPPYKYAKEFVLKALESVDNGRKVIMLLKVQFLESDNRYKDLFSKYPPKYVYVFSKRILCRINGDFSKNTSSAMCYCWYVWQKGFKGETILRWIP